MNACKQVLAVLDRIGRLDVVISAVTMFSIVCICIWGVITRYFLGDPAGWVGELSLALFVWLTFFGTSILARRGEIVNIEFLLNYLPGGLAFIIKRILSTLLLVGCLVVLVYLGYELTIFSHDRYTSILRIPYSYIYGAIPVGSLFTLYHVLRHAFIGRQDYEEMDTPL